MPKSLNDILKGVKKSSTEPLTTGKHPGVDYADKAKDTRDFVAQHSVEKHEDRFGNGDDVYAASKVKNAVMKRHGHEPKPKDIKVYNKTQQVGEEVELEEAKAPAIGSYHKVDTEGSHGKHVVTNVADGVVYHQNVKTKEKHRTRVSQWANASSPIKEEVEQINEALSADHKSAITKHIKKMWGKGTISFEKQDGKHFVSHSDGIQTHVHSIDMKKGVPHVTHFMSMDEETELTEAKCNMTEAGTMCEVHGKKACPKEDDESAENKEPKYTGKKDKPGKQLITDKKDIQEKLTKKTSAGEVISDFVHSDDPKFAGKSKEERKRMALGAYYGMHPEKSKKKVNESISDQRSSKSTASEKAREKIFAAMQKKKERMEKMREESAAAEPAITFPVTNSREGFRV